jgi:serine/threonine protein kinase
MSPLPEEPKRSLESTQFATIHLVDTSIGSHESALCVSLLEPPRSAGEMGWFQHYRVLRQLGRGGMGIVFLAEDVHLRRSVALKVMHQCLLSDVEARRRFLREARALGAIQHEHVATIYHVGTGASHDHRQIPYLAMQYLEGETLQERLLRPQPLALADALRIGREIAEGLEAAHSKGLIHRDIKPSNIWLVRPQGGVKILDFGLAQLLESASTISSPGQIVGSLHFMSPEQARGEPVDARSDLFSLGSVIYAMLARRLPFEGPTPSAALTKLTDEEPVALLDCVQDLPPAVAQLVHHLLAKSPADRPANTAFVQATLAKLEMECQRPRDGSPSTGRSTGCFQSELPTATPDAIAETPGPSQFSTFPNWPSIRIAPRFRRKPLVGRRAFLFWSAVAAASSIGAAVYLIGRESGKIRQNNSSKRINKTNR